MIADILEDSTLIIRRSFYFQERKEQLIAGYLGTLTLTPEEKILWQLIDKARCYFQASSTIENINSCLLFHY